MIPNWSLFTAILLPYVLFSRVTLGRELNIKCPLDGEYKHGLPETNCQRYYVCKGSHSVEYHTCPAGTYYSPPSKDCRASGSCYNVVCAGRVDGRYADATEDCTRWFECSGGALETIESCPLGYHFNELNDSCVPAGAVTCPKLSSSLVVKVTNPCHGHPDGYFPVHGSTIYVKCMNQVEVETLSCPSGQKFDGWSCTSHHSDDACSSKSDGYHMEDTTHCTAYVLCKDHQIVLKSKCPAGTSFNGRTCEPHRFHSCASKKDRECRGLPTNYYPNVENNCKSYFHCVDDVLVKEVHCPQGLLWDGLRCSPQGYFKCEENRSNECTGKRGYIADVSSKCKKYHYCSHGKKMTFHCPLGQIFNGVKCVSDNDHECPEKNENSCDGKSSGYYTDTESNCRSYYYCANGYKIVYVCPPKQVFDGSECVDKEQFKCLTPPHTECADRLNGYHRVQRSLRDYIYCSDGVKLITLQCEHNEVYDGEKCVNVTQYKSMCNNVKFGHITDRSCRVYYLCRDGSVINSGVCLGKYVFDGNSCVPRSQERCDRGSIKSCSGAPNGFYADFNTDCRQYFYCINGQKTQLSCPNGQVHNGDICVPIHQYTCPSLAANIA